VTAALAELDTMFPNVATRTYTGEYWLEVFFLCHQKHASVCKLIAPGRFVRMPITGNRRLARTRHPEANTLIYLPCQQH